MPRVNSAITLSADQTDALTALARRKSVAEDAVVEEAVVAHLREALRQQVSAWWGGLTQAQRLAIYKEKNP